MKIIKINEALSPKEVKERFCKYNGFNLDGEGWTIIGETYSIKEDIKTAGGVWNSTLKRWVAPEDISKIIDRPTYKINADDYYNLNKNGIWNYLDPDYSNIEILQRKLNDEDASWKNTNAAPSKVSTTRVGLKGDRITINIKEASFLGFSSGGYFIYKFIDTDDAVYIWYASNDYRTRLSEIQSLTGTVVDHREYKGETQTILTRCKVSTSPAASVVKPEVRSRARNGNFSGRKLQR